MAKTVCSGGEVTGEFPLAALGQTFGGRDDFDMSDWSGCLDAPILMPAGSVVPVNISPDIGGMGYEGNVARLIER